MVKPTNLNSMLKIWSILIIGTFLVFSCTEKSTKKKGIVHNENTEWANTWIVNTNDTLKPKVLLIGDSHVERYYGIVSKSLGDTFSCSKFTTSKSLGDPVFVQQLELLMNQYKFDFITINNGLHGLKYSTQEYSSYLPVVHEVLKKSSEGSVLWVNTTAIRQKNNITAFDIKNEDVTERNSSLLEFIQNNGIPLLDFYSVTADSIQFYTNDVIHFNQLGVERQANLLADKIMEIHKSSSD